MNEISLQFGKKPVKFMLDLNAKDAAMFEQGQMYEPDMSGLFAAILRPGDTVIDVGANVGWFTILSASLVGPEGTVYAFEPAPENVKRLKKHVQVNNLNNVRIIEAAVSDHCAPGDPFYLNHYGNGGHAFYNMQESRPDLIQPTVVQVRTVTLDSMCDTFQPPRLIKIDTEGHDVRVLDGARVLIDRYRPPYIFSELHGGISMFNDTQLGLFSMMHEHGYHAYLMLQGLPLPVQIPLGTQIKSKYALNLLFAEPEAVAKLFPEIEISYEPTP